MEKNFTNKSIRDNIAAKMRALAAKTVENGCTEAEASIAFDMLQKLQTKYNFTLNEASVRGEGISFISYSDVNKLSLMTLPGINALANVSAVYDEQSNSVLFFGTPHDCEYAHYLFAIVNGSFVKSWNKFILTKEYATLRRGRNPNGTKRSFSAEYLKESFYIGISERLLNRLLDMAKENEEILTTTGKELVIVKESMQKEAMERVGIQTMAISKEIKVNHLAHEKGLEAGDDIALNKGIETVKVVGRLK